MRCKRGNKQNSSALYVGMENSLKSFRYKMKKIMEENVKLIIWREVDFTGIQMEEKLFCFNLREEVLTS